MRILLVIALLLIATSCSKEADGVWERTRSITYTKDVGPDYWQTPSETYKRGKGDCDDFAMIHYLALLDEGEYPTLKVGRSIQTGEVHLWVESKGYAYSNKTLESAPLHGYVVMNSFTHLQNTDRRYKDMEDRLAKEKALN